MSSQEKEPTQTSPETPIEKIEKSLKALTSAIGSAFGEDYQMNKIHKKNDKFLFHLNIRGSLIQIIYNSNEGILSIETPSRANTPDHITRILNSISDQPSTKEGGTTSWIISQDILVKPETINLFDPQPEPTEEERQEVEEMEIEEE